MSKVWDGLHSFLNFEKWVRNVGGRTFCGFLQSPREEELAKSVISWCCGVVNPLGDVQEPPSTEMREFRTWFGLVGGSLFEIRHVILFYWLLVSIICMRFWAYTSKAIDIHREERLVHLINLGESIDAVFLRGG